MLAEMGKFIHAAEGEMVCESINPKIPFFNAPVYLENKVALPVALHITRLTASDYDREGG